MPTLTDGELRQIKAQADLSRSLAFGIALSLVFGIGSVGALYIGLRSLKTIRQSGHTLRGDKTTWWCIVVGALGVLYGAYVLYIIFANRTPPIDSASRH